MGKASVVAGKRRNRSVSTARKDGARSRGGGTSRRDGARNGATGRMKFRSPKNDLEAAMRRYAELYDFAPIAYISLDRNGRIEELNLAGAKLLGRSRHVVIGRPFALYVAKPDVKVFLHHLFRCRTQDKKNQT